MSTKNKYLIVIGGPTASGKTELAIKVAQHFKCSIISADSRQFYRQMNIGTAKPAPEELALAKHYFIDSLDIVEYYSVGNFEKDAIQLLDELYKTADFAVLAGGSGLYHKAVCEGLDDFPEVEQEFTAKSEMLYANEGILGLQEELLRLDPDQYKKMDTNNTQRLKRALSVCYATGEPYSSFLKKNRKPRNFIPLYFCTDLPREILYEKIDSRVDKMIAAGLEEEVRGLSAFKETNALQTVGYKEWYSYWSGEYPGRAFTIDKIKQHSRNYAKRQLTWFRNQGDYTFIDPSDWKKLINEIEALI